MEQKEHKDLVKAYRHDLPRFFADITGYTPTDKQKEFLKDLENLEKEKFLLVAGRSTGKTMTLGLVACWYAIVLSQYYDRKIEVIVVSGSEKQSMYLLKHIREWRRENEWFKDQLLKDSRRDPITMKEIRFENGSRIYANAHSVVDIMGSHGQLLIYDESCDIKQDIWDISEGGILKREELGEVMHQRTIYSGTPWRAGSYFVTYYFYQQDRLGLVDHRWTWNDVPWKLERDMEEFEGTKKYKPHVMGLPPTKVGQEYFPIDTIRNCRTFKEPKFGGERLIMGIDANQGGEHNTASYTALSIIGEETFVYLNRVFEKEKTFDDVIEEIEVLAAHPLKDDPSAIVSQVYVDSNPPFFAKKLRKELKIPVKSIFMRKYRPWLNSNLLNLMKKKKIKIHDDNYELFKDFRKYTGKNDSSGDRLDSLLLAVWREDWRSDSAPKENDIPLEDVIEVIKR